MHHLEIEAEERRKDELVAAVRRQATQIMAEKANAAMEPLRRRAQMVDDYNEPTHRENSRVKDEERSDIKPDIKTDIDGVAANKTADWYLRSAADEMHDRAVSRDKSNGERSMARAVNAFNALHGTQLTETQGWQFMVTLKAARAAGGKYREDDYTDAVAYAALAAESANKEACNE